MTSCIKRSWFDLGMTQAIVGREQRIAANKPREQPVSSPRTAGCISPTNGSSWLKASKAEKTLFHLPRSWRDQMVDSHLTEPQRRVLEATARDEVCHDTKRFTFLINGRGSPAIWRLWRAGLIAPGKRLDRTNALMELTPRGRAALAKNSADERGGKHR